MEWLSEDPWPLGGTLLVAAAICLALVRFTQQGKYLQWAGVAVVLALLVFGVEHFWVTDRERIEAALYRIRDAVVRSDFDALDAQLAPDFGDEEETPLSGPLSRAITKAYIRGRLQGVQFEFVSLSRVDISDPGQLTRQATADFTARASWKEKTSTGGPDFNGTPPQGTRWSFGFREVEPKVWKVTRIDMIDTGLPNISPEQALGEFAKMGGGRK